MPCRPSPYLHPHDACEPELCLQHGVDECAKDGSRLGRGRRGARRVRRGFEGVAVPPGVTQPTLPDAADSPWKVPRICSSVASWVGEALVAATLGSFIRHCLTRCGKELAGRT